MTLKKAHNLSACALSGLLFILVLLSAMLVLKTFQINDQTETDTKLFEKEILFRSTEVFKPMRAVHLLTKIDPDDLPFPELKEMVLELSDRAIAHNYSIIPLHTISESHVFENGDPLFLRDDYADVYAKYHKAIASLESTADLLKVIASREVFLREFEDFRKENETLADAFNGLNNYYSKFQSFYFSHVRTALEKNLNNLNNYLIFLPFLSCLLLASMLFFLSFQRRSSRSLAQSEEKSRLILDSTAEGIYGLDTSGNCTFTNPACLNLLGYDREEDLLGANMHEFIRHTNADGVKLPAEECGTFRTIRDGEETYFPRTLLHRADKTSFFAEIWAHPIRREGQVIGAVVTFFDVTERIKAEEALARNNQLAAAGQLASGIAHEINNPLATISACVEVLEGEGIKTEESGFDSVRVTNYLNMIREETERAAGIIGDLLSFTRQRPHRTESFDMIDAIKSTISLFKIQTQYNAYDFDETIAYDTPHIKGDRDRIRQVLIILISNAAESMAQGGLISISLRGDDENAQVILEISDHGKGIPAEDLGRIFQPFFTTKLEEKGTGLGLSIAHSIIIRHNGWISVKSTPGEGSTFTVKFPTGGGGKSGGGEWERGGEGEKS